MLKPWAQIAVARKFVAQTMLPIWRKLARLKAWLETLASDFGMPKLSLS
jgi:hypothetical protein